MKTKNNFMHGSGGSLASGAHHPAAGHPGGA
jgi:hypothetical protein